MSFITEVLKRWTVLSVRERRLLTMGMMTVLLALGYGFIYAPMQVENSRLQQQIQAQQQIYRHLQELAQRVNVLRQPRVEAPTALVEPTLAISESSRQMGLETYIRAQPADGDGRIEIVLTPLPFDKLVYWLAGLQQQQGLRVMALDVRRAARDSSLIEGELTLAKPAN